MNRCFTRRSGKAITSGKIASKHGFTLIELLVVISIIALLAAVLFPVFATAREKARQATCASNMKQVGLAVLQYVQDNDEEFPTGVDWGCQWSNCNPIPDSTPHWQQTIVGYINANGIFSCPDDSLGNTSPVGSSYQGIYTSYAANGYSDYVAPSYALINEGVMGDTISKNPGQPMAKIGEPSASIMFFECFSSDLVKAGQAGNLTNFAEGDVYTGNSWTNWGAVLPSGTNPISTTFGQGQYGEVSVHHSGSTMANFTFVDGHVKAMRPAATDPDPTNQPQNNMWIATRT